MIEILPPDKTKINPCSFCEVLPKNYFNVILPRLQELEQQAKIELKYRTYKFDVDPNNVYVKCLAVSSVADHVYDLIYGLYR